MPAVILPVVLSIRVTAVVGVLPAQADAATTVVARKPWRWSVHFRI
ncbi:hypothetical protein [Nannocystis radixulma]|uniref:Uncharacterized protein n=1 Tax=Nannocystis radixulma TaxID=2995305 RepID=A0ABT5B1K6_9BACT|nr:hypothetical protein [Nannocystis radixulma]MDC0667980.1 hypothetical protein [Nannocystis radixulma]